LLIVFVSEKELDSESPKKFNQERNQKMTKDIYLTKTMPFFIFSLANLLDIKYYFHHKTVIIHEPESIRQCLISAEISTFSFSSSNALFFISVDRFNRW
jgi:hypothetical protein